MKKIRLLGGLLFLTVMTLLPTCAAYAKEVPADGNIPLTAEYFPDEYFLNMVSWYDKNKDGSLSPEETAAVDWLWITEKLTDFSQVQYFTNLRKLDVLRSDETRDVGVWIDTDMDLTVFPNLETVEIELDSR